MNIKEYISSGIVESYVLGLTTPEEKAEFEKLCREYPDLVKARNDFEMALERRMTSMAKTPEPAIKDKVLNAIRQQFSVNQTKVINMEQSRTSRPGGMARFVAAASVILFLAAGYFAYKFYSENKKLETDLAKSKDDQTKMDDQLKKMEMVTDPNVAVVNLKGLEKTPKSSASIYWDSTSSNIYLVAKNLPKPASDKQYQLWSIINGQGGQLEPTSLGLFDVGDDGKIILKIDKAVKKADAFAITIENRGNTGGPTLEQLQTMGKTTL